MCRQMDRQIDCVAQICSTLLPALSGVEQLRLIFDEQVMPTEWQNGEIDGTMWHELLRVFGGVKELHICAALTQELSRALQVNDVGSDPGFLPVLQGIVSESKGSDVENLFSSFIHARQIAGNPVYPMERARYPCALSESLPSPFLTAIMLISNITVTDTASTDDPNEISFSKGEILVILEKSGSWWLAKKVDGTEGST
ncbi:hypothetical protein EI94DRAFT_82043 [Lactarius quietus]|nr:hypothetical protein EI94DRAFT_82043 [Lactarius quietus]